MTIGISMLLIAVGAVLKWAVTAHVSGFDIHTAGTVLFVIGLAGLLLSLFYVVLWNERERDLGPRDARYRPPQAP
jgi:hypothetical protein